MEQTERKRERKYCSRLGFALLLALGCAVLWPYALMLAEPLLPLPGPLYFLLLLTGHYAVSLPLAFALCRGIPRGPLTPRPLRVMQLARWFAIGAALMLAGSILGDAACELAFRLAGRPSVDLLSETLNLLPEGVTLVGACVLAPVCEELLFRGLAANRLSRYGQKPAAMVSALLFALFHANLGQFFYSFGLGALLAYAYFCTGRLLAPVLLHMLFNFLGSGLPVLLPQSEAVLLMYALGWLALAAVGAVLLAAGRGGQRWAHGPSAPSMRTIFVNPGIMLLLIACFAELTYNFAFI